MDLRDLHRLIDFHYWARDRVLDAAGALTPGQFTQEVVSSFRSVRDTLAHVYSSEWVWLSRWMGHSPAAHLSPDAFADVAALKGAWLDHEVKVRAFLSGLDEEGINRTIEYQQFNGKPATSALWQMVQHVVNHGTYHRGQVVTLLRQLGAAPPRSLDVIVFYREREKGGSIG